MFLNEEMSSKISKTSKKQSSSPKKRNSSVPKCFAFLILLLSIFFFSRKGNQMTSTKDEISIPKSKELYFFFDNR